MQTLFSASEGSGQAPERLLARERAPEELTEDWRRAKAAREQAAGKPSFPTVLRVLRGICSFLVFVTVLGIARADVTLAQGYENAPGIFWAGGIALALAGVLFLAQRMMEERHAGQPDAELQLANAEGKIRRYLEVPEYAVTTDVLSFPHPEDPQLGALRQMALFRRNEALCLLDEGQLYALPLAGAALRLEQREIPVERSGWRKPLPPSHKQFKPYGLTVRKGGQMSLRFCCALEFWQDGELLCLLFPAYELAQFQRLTGLQAPTLP